MSCDYDFTTCPRCKDRPLPPIKKCRACKRLSHIQLLLYAHFSYLPCAESETLSQNKRFFAIANCADDRKRVLRNMLIIGNDNIVRGKHLLVIGKRNVVFGDFNRVRGDKNIVFGRHCTNVDSGSTGVASGAGSFRIGGRRLCVSAKFLRKLVERVDNVANQPIRHVIDTKLLVRADGKDFNWRLAYQFLSRI